MSRKPRRKRLKWLLAILGLGLATLGGVVFVCTQMPGQGHTGPLPANEADADTAARLAATVHFLAHEVGPRNLDTPKELERARKHIVKAFRKQGFDVFEERVEVGQRETFNLVAELPGKGASDEIVIVGAHYDTAVGTPGADDNASGVAALLELSRRLASQTPKRTVRFVAFANEEPPYFQSRHMGSVVHAEGVLERGDTVVAMLSLETLGYYSDESGSQSYPPGADLLYPGQGDFVAFVSDLGSLSLVRRATASFRDHVAFPSQGMAAPDAIPGIGWSDHWSFYERGIPAVMVTDTAPFRNPHYHRATDVPAEVQPDKLARVVRGLEGVILDLADE